MKKKSVAKRLISCNITVKLRHVTLSSFRSFSMKFSRAGSLVRLGSYSDVSGYNSVPISRVHALKMGTELVTETLGKLHILTRLSAREKFTEFCSRESSYTVVRIICFKTKYCIN